MCRIVFWKQRLGPLLSQSIWRILVGKSSLHKLVLKHPAILSFLLGSRRASLCSSSYVLLHKKIPQQLQFSFRTTRFALEFLHLDLAMFLPPKHTFASMILSCALSSPKSLSLNWLCASSFLERKTQFTYLLVQA